MNAMVKVCLACIVLMTGALVQAEPRKASPAETAAIETSEIWAKIQAQLFGQRKIDPNADSLIEFDVPARADDAAVVPVSLRTRMTATPERFVSRLYLIIDKNPSPISAVFSFTPDSGRADIETRVRVEQYTPIRAIAELNTGELYMAARFIKASGGCSAPAGKDAEAALANVGKMRLRVDPEVRFNEPNLVQLMVSHPNTSGLSMDQVSRLYAPAYYVRSVAVSYGGKPVFSADVDFSISENPHFRFYFLPKLPGELKAEVIDTRDKSFVARLAVGERSASAVPATDAR
jgi:sulfur-oxidizing protein SoxY